MAVLVLPIVIITSMEAIRAVPQGLRDAGFGVGASRWEVTRDHVLPYAAPGILTGAVLVGRPGARRGGAAASSSARSPACLPKTQPDRTSSPPCRCSSSTGRGAPTTPDSDIGWANAAAAAGLMLLILVLFFNAAAIVLRNRFERRRVGG